MEKKYTLDVPLSFLMALQNYQEEYQRSCTQFDSLRYNKSVLRLLEEVVGLDMSETPNVRPFGEIGKTRRA